MRRAAAATGGMALAAFLALCTQSVARAGGDSPAASGALPEPYAAANLRRGKILYLQCQACHDLEPSGIVKVGPALAGLPGSAAGFATGFAYSDALRRSGITWTAATLDAFLARPAALVPGTTMVFAGISKASDRAALVRYLFEETAVD